MFNKAVFFDRDGTIIEEVNYLSKIEQVKILSNSPSAIKLLNENGFLVIIITNQSGLAREYFSVEDLENVNKHLKNELLKSNAKIDAIYYCPHHPDDDCECRKPRIGLIKKAEEEMNIDLRSSFLVGDKISDVQAGLNAGLKSILVLTGYGKEERTKLDDMNLKVDFIASDILSAVLWILRENDS